MCVRPSQGISGTVSHRMVGPVWHSWWQRWQTPVVKNWVAEGTDLSQSVNQAGVLMRHVLLGAVGWWSRRGTTAPHHPPLCPSEARRRGCGHKEGQQGEGGQRANSFSVLSTEAKARQKHGDLSIPKAAGGPTKLGGKHAKKRGKMMPMSIATERTKDSCGPTVVCQGGPKRHRGRAAPHSRGGGDPGPSGDRWSPLPAPSGGGPLSLRGLLEGTGGAACVCATKERWGRLPQGNFLSMAQSHRSQSHSSSTDPKAQKGEPRGVWTSTGEGLSFGKVEGDKRHSSTKRSRCPARNPVVRGPSEAWARRCHHRRGLRCRWGGVCLARIWLILPVVICFVQGLSHAYLSAHGRRQWICVWLLTSAVIYVIECGWHPGVPNGHPPKPGG